VGRGGHGGGGVTFDSRSQLAPRIQDALGRMGRGGRESETEVERVSFYRKGTKEPLILFSLHFTFRGKKKCRKGSNRKKRI